MGLTPRLRSAAALSTRFLIVGALSTVIEIGLLNLLHYAFHMPLVWAKITASLVALVNAYFGNREWAFKDRGRHGRRTELVLFLVVNGVCTLLGAAIVWLGAWMFPGSGPLLVNLINLVSIALAVVARFAFYHWVVFPGARERPRQAQPEPAVERTDRV